MRFQGAHGFRWRSVANGSLAGGYRLPFLVTQHRAGFTLYVNDGESPHRGARRSGDAGQVPAHPHGMARGISSGAVYFAVTLGRDIAH